MIEQVDNARAKKAMRAYGYVLRIPLQDVDNADAIKAYVRMYDKQETLVFSGTEAGTLAACAAHINRGARVMRDFWLLSESNPDAWHILCKFAEKLEEMQAKYTEQLAKSLTDMKYDSDKPRMDLVILGFPRALLAVAEVATFGASKYAPDSWLSVPDGFRRYLAAQHRHALVAATGEVQDAESGLPHYAHEAWNALAKLELYLRELELTDSGRDVNIR